MWGEDIVADPYWVYAYDMNMGHKQHYHFSKCDRVSRTWEEDQMETQEREELPEWALSQEHQEAQHYKVHVAIGESLRTDVHMLVFKEETVRSVTTLQLRLSDMLGVKKERIVIYEASDLQAPVPEWHRTPQYVRAEDALVEPTPAFDYINILSLEQQQEFIIKAHPDMTHDQFMLMIAKVVNVSPMQLYLKDFRGQLWIYPESKHHSTSATLTIRRGGMHQGQAGIEVEIPHSKEGICLVDLAF